MDKQPKILSYEDDNVNEAPKRAPGRPRGSTNRPASEKAAAPTADVNKALASLQSLYDTATAILLVAGLPATSLTLAGRIEELQEANKKALSASPKLAKSIASAGSTGGAVTFFIANAMTVGAVAATARAELAAKRPEPEPDPDVSAGGY